MECLTLKKANCKNCYKCIRHCPVKAIRFSGNQAYIIQDECIMCGQCFVVCPQEAKQIVDETGKVRVMLQSGAPVVASLAPSFIANYAGSGIEELREALKKLGFYDAEETALGATVVKREYDRMVMEADQDIIISSCCPSVNLLIRRYYPSLLGYLAPVMSPMQAHCADIKRRIPGAKTVFIGPCVAKKEEAQECEEVDAVLTFDELTAWLNQEHIAVSQAPELQKGGCARLFPTAGGILRSMEKPNQDYVYMAVDGAENCLAVMEDLLHGGLHRCFIEMSMCTGSCVGGPVMEKFHRSPVRDYQAVERVAGREDFNLPQPEPALLRQKWLPLIKERHLPSERELTDILRKMGKKKPEDELNCGSCGYNTCREKAIAVYQGKAEISMCLPYLKDRAESFTGNVLDNSPNGFILLNEKLEIQQINRAALAMMNLSSPSDVLGEPIVRILDPGDFFTVLESGHSVEKKRVYLSEYNRYAEETIVMDREFHQIICILRDVTEEERVRRQKEELSRQTAEIADGVVAKQMRIVQEIASLLGETAAETKIALYKLKGSVSDE
ncbi:MAG TPA: histidine kinase [Ruminococcaceae bacterium]|nr:histidine kinase [Oscillospiraceae bacterium]